MIQLMICQIDMLIIQKVLKGWMMNRQIII